MNAKPRSGSPRPTRDELRARAVVEALDEIAMYPDAEQPAIVEMLRDEALKKLQTK
jgi:hypothetical protein